MRTRQRVSSRRRSASPALQTSTGRGRVESLERRTLLSGWSTVDAANPPDFFTEVDAMTADHAGKVYAVGVGSSAEIVRSSSDGGASWATTSQFPTSQAFGSMAVDGAGNLFMSGAGGGGHWLVEEQPAG